MSLSTVLTVIIRREVHQMQSSLSKIQEQVAAMQEQNFEREKIRDYLEPTAATKPHHRCSHIPETRMKQWNTRIRNCLGISVSMIVSRVKGRDKCTVFLRWPMFSSKILNGRIISSWSSWLSPSIDLCLRVHNTVPADSIIVEACRRNDVLSIRELFLSGKAHPHDTTPDNLTLLYVCSPTLELYKLG